MDSSTNLEMEGSPSYADLILVVVEYPREEANIIYRGFPYKGLAVSTVPRRWHTSFGKKCLLTS